MGRKQDIPNNLVKVSPSDFSFAWRECKRCLYLKWVRGIVRPSKPMASIYGSIDRAMRAYYMGRSVELESAGAHLSLVADTKERRLQSAPFFVEGYEKGVFISGKNDALAFPAAIAEGDERWCEVWDFKTSRPKDAHVGLYGNQLEGYAWCLEHPADVTAMPIPVRANRLVIFEPMAYEPHLATVADMRALTGKESSIPLARNAAGFETFLREVVALVNSPVPPVPNGICAHCETDREIDRLTLQVQKLEAQLAA